MSRPLALAAVPGAPLRSAAGFGWITPEAVEDGDHTNSGHVGARHPAADGKRGARED